MRSVEEIKADIKRHENRLGNLDFNQDDERCHIQIAEHELRWTLTSAIPLDRLEAICAAEREGRCVVLPCALKSTVYVLNEYGGVYDCFVHGRQYLCDTDYPILLATTTLSDGSTYNAYIAHENKDKYWFLTRAEAEAALWQK